MRLQARERIPNATAAYLEAYVALELSARETQTLIDRLWSITLALTEARTPFYRHEAWKVASIDELPARASATTEPGQSIRLTKMPTAKQLLEAVGDWRKKRSYLQQLWNSLPAEVRPMLNVPETLD